MKLKFEAMKVKMEQLQQSELVAFDQIWIGSGEASFNKLPSSVYNYVYFRYSSLRKAMENCSFLHCYLFSYVALRCKVINFVHCYVTHMTKSMPFCPNLLSPLLGMAFLSISGFRVTTLDKKIR